MRAPLGVTPPDRQARSLDTALRLLLKTRLPLTRHPEAAHAVREPPKPRSSMQGELHDRGDEKCGPDTATGDASFAFQRLVFIA